jgi:hypothetical protein
LAVPGCSRIHPIQSSATMSNAGLCRIGSCQCCICAFSVILFGIIRLGMRQRTRAPSVHASKRCATRLELFPHNAVSGELLPRRFHVQKRMNCLLCPKLLWGGDTMAAIVARLAGFHDVLHIDNSIVMR